MLYRKLFVSVLLLTCTSSLPAAENTLTDDEKKAGFELLFNGRNFEGWEQGGNWAIEDGAMARQGKGGSLIYKVKKVPDDFELQFDWKIGKKSNSGVYYQPGQYEYQILDNARHSNGINPRQTAASLYFCLAPSRDATRPIGKWNEGRIVCQGSIIQHWLNGERVIDFDYSDPKWADDVERLRLRGGKLEARGAYLSLQDHGDPVWFRNVRMREIPKSEKIEHIDITPQPMTAAGLKSEAAKVESLLKRKAAK